MFNLQTIVDVSNFISNKEQTGKTLTTAQINTIFSEINIECFNIIYREYEKSQRSKDSITPFIKVLGENETTPLMINKYGVAITPLDYAHADEGGIWYTWVLNNEDKLNENSCGRMYIEHNTGSKVRQRQVLILMDSEVSNYLSDSIKEPTLENPVCVFRNGYIQFYPSNLNNVKFSYVRYPQTPLYVTTQDLQTLQESYDATNSIEFEYKQEDYPLLISLFLNHLGCNLSRKDLIEMAQLKLQTL